MWYVTDSDTRKVIATMPSLKAANKYASRLNKAYGAVRYTPIYRAKP